MKIKGDFITNSSSTSLIVYIPETFDIVEHLSKMSIFEYFDEYRNYCNNCNEDDDDKILDGYKQEIISTFEDLKNGYLVVEDDSMYEAYKEIVDIILCNNFCIEKIVDSDMRGKILNINSVKYRDKINKLNSNSEDLYENKK
jgi:hypothetical protein